MSRIFVGVAWPYANGPVHIGQLAGAYVPADIFARYHRLRGDEVLFVSGSDMHGTPILLTAEREGTTADTVAERNHRIHASTFQRLGISFDLYTHTRTEVHARTVEELFLRLLERGYLQRQTQESPYCPKELRFLPDRYLTGTCPFCGSPSARGDECDRCGRPLDPRGLQDPHCRICGSPAEFRPSEHFYLRLDKIQPELEAWIARQTHWRPGTRRVAESFLAEGLHPTPITRDIDWGIPLPLDGYAGKRFYVWFEAVQGYLSASKEWAIRRGDPAAYRRFWEVGEGVRSYYFVGKDNKFHHTILWPGLLLAAGGLPLPYDVPSNEWMLIDGDKMSKSSTSDLSVFAPALLERLAPDLIRFYVALLAPQNHDTEFQWEEFHSVSEEILSNQWGNLVQRTLVLIRNRLDHRIPRPPPGWSPDDPQGLGPRLRALHERITAEYEQVHLKEALDLALAEVRDANRRLHEAKPWQAPPAERDRALVEAVWKIRAIAIWLAPILPFSSAEVFRMLGEPSAPGPGSWELAREPLPAGQRLGKLIPLFPRPTVPEATPAPSAPTAPAGAPPTGEAPPLGIVVGLIRRAAVHPSADKLYVLEVDLGEATPRSIVAGLRASYPREALEGRSVLVVANLASRSLRGVPSQGMLLAADVEGRAVLLSPPPGLPPGTRREGSRPDDRIISYDEFAATPFRVGEVVGPEGSGSSRVSLGKRPIRVVGNWPVSARVVVRLRAPEASEGEVLTMSGSTLVEVAPEVPLGATVR
ncbi:MAG: methionine--tRNA ligase [Thermoplasmata archaeon]